MLNMACLAVRSILHARIFSDLQLGAIQDTHSTPQILGAMAMFAYNLACASAMFAFVPIQLQPEVFGPFHNDSCRKKLCQTGVQHSVLWEAQLTVTAEAVGA